jgi:hypothetical protein
LKKKNEGGGVGEKIEGILPEKKIWEREKRNKIIK